MSSYKHLYFKLFNKMSDILEAIKVAQAEAEEYFISHDEDNEGNQDNEGNEENNSK